MDTLLAEMTSRLEDPALARHRVITWSSPVPSFGDSVTSRVATLGLNPSNREFVGAQGEELEGQDRRLHTLASLGLHSWCEVNSNHLESILEACSKYFERNPYDAWFKSLDQLISGTGYSYYDSSRSACHLDLIPYATACKWTQLASKDREGLLSIAGDTLGLVLRQSAVRLLVMNGQSVVDNLKKLAGVEFARQEMPGWALPRSSGAGVTGFSFSGTITHIGGVRLGRCIQVLGYNHNIQSSFGVTNRVKHAIQYWVTDMSREVLW